MTTKKENDEQPITDISIYIAALSATYRPALTPAETTHFFSTPEVIDAIRNLDPSAKVCAEKITKALLDAGYKFCNRPGAQGLEFRWMFREI